MTFSKGGAPVLTRASLVEIIKDSADFALSGSAVKVQYEFDDKLWAANIDTAQISQVMQNLIINSVQGAGSSVISNNTAPCSLHPKKMYSEKILKHFRNPHNQGFMNDPDGVGEIGNPSCGDIMKLYIKVKDNRITDIKFETLGCGAAIATSSMITDLAKGKTLKEAMKITNQDIASDFGGLPPIKMHCSNLAADALKKAIKDYQNKVKK